MAAITMTSSPLLLHLPTSPRRCLLLRRPLKVTRRPVAFPAANGSFNGSVCFPSALLFVVFLVYFCAFFWWVGLRVVKGTIRHFYVFLARGLFAVIVILQVSLCKLRKKRCTFYFKMMPLVWWSS